MALDQRRQWTFEEYQDRPDELVFAELWDGELLLFGEQLDGSPTVTPAPKPWHQELAGTIYHRLRGYLDVHPLGRAFMAPLDVRLVPTANRALHPDVLFVARDRVGIITNQGISGVPDLVVEVLSQGTAKFDLGAKKAAYEAAGVPEYWALWQDWPRVEVYRLNNAGKYGNPHLLEAGDSLTSDLLPGFALAVDDLYRDLPASEK